MEEEEGEWKNCFIKTELRTRKREGLSEGNS